MMFLVDPLFLSSSCCFYCAHQEPHRPASLDGDALFLSQACPEGWMKLSPCKHPHGGVGHGAEARRQRGKCKEIQKFILTV